MKAVPVATVVSVDGQSPGRPTPGPLPTLQNEGGAREFLCARQWPESIQDVFIQNVSRTPLRFFICDDSGSMQTSDGTALVESGGVTK